RPADGFQRRAEPVTGPGLDLADDQHPAIHRDDVDLAVDAPPVPVEYPQPRLLQELGGEVLAMPAEGIFGLHLAPPPVLTLPCGPGGGGLGLWPGDRASQTGRIVDNRAGVSVAGASEPRPSTPRVPGFHRTRRAQPVRRNRRAERRMRLMARDRDTTG